MRTDIKHPEYLFFAAVVASAFLLVGSPPEKLPSAEIAAASALTRAAADPFAAVELSAKAAYVYDVKAKRKLYGVNEREVLPLASIAKIMTAATALSLVPETTYVTIDGLSLREEGDSGLSIGERWLLRDLLAFMLLESSNDGAVAVAQTIGATLPADGDFPDHRALFVEKMNELAHSIGLVGTYFLNESGLDLPASGGGEAAGAGAYSTAEETARLLAYALAKFPAVFRETRWSELALGAENGDAHSAQNTNKGVGHLPLLIASKTGYTDLAGGNLVIAFDAGFNHPIIVVALGSTTDGRFEDVEKLVWATLEYLSQDM